MYGDYDYDLHITKDEISIDVSDSRGFLTYTRVCQGNKLEKNIASEYGRIAVNPVEPVNLPQKITTFLEIRFDKTMIEPYSSKVIYLTFPIEIGVFVAARKDVEVLDVFSLKAPKYTLYGPPAEGVIARIHRSPIYSVPPSVDPLRLGVMELAVRNDAAEWAEISRAVFESHGMKIYYDREIVSLVARMRLHGRHGAETDFLNRPVRSGMVKSIEVYRKRDIPAMRRGYAMEWGVD